VKDEIQRPNLAALVAIDAHGLPVLSLVVLSYLKLAPRAMPFFKLSRYFR
jgi:hypothetical protein